MALAGDKLQKLWADLADANPENVASCLDDAPAPGAPSFAQLSQELKRLKFTFIDAEAQRQFAEYASQGRRILEEPPDAASLDSKRKDAKEKNQSLKQRIERESQLNSQLVKELAEATRKASDLYEQCQHDLKDAESAQQAAGAADLDLQLGANRVVEALGQSDQAAVRGAQEARQLWAAREEMASRRRRLEQEIRNAEEQRRQNLRRTAALAKEQESEQRRIESFEQLLEVEEKLGLPKLVIDHARGVALLGEPLGPEDQELCGDEAEAIRTIQVEFDQDGTLLKAEPHPALGLQQVASKAIARQDFGLLATHAWARLQQDAC
eukprot:TRINITY_DN45199_c0_g1_i1.p1 TRINITY_DN45199_c0_g1~~TRINITY_DN45199_c0_g1_i1.p1  ORF type:complete len:324 (+),score=96.27 TRINITY_DN45199_c0_g1_i1:52-1023(+)